MSTGLKDRKKNYDKSQEKGLIKRDGKAAEIECLGEGMLLLYQSFEKVQWDILGKMAYSSMNCIICSSVNLQADSDPVSCGKISFFDFYGDLH